MLISIVKLVAFTKIPLLITVIVVVKFDEVQQRGIIVGKNNKCCIDILK